MVQQLVVLLNCLCKAEARIQIPVLDACLICLGCKVLEELQNLCHNAIRIVSKRSHGLWRSAHVHRNVGESKAAYDSQHPPVNCAGGNIVHYEGADQVVNLLYDAGIEGIYGNRSLRSGVPNYW